MSDNRYNRDEWPEQPEMQRASQGMRMSGGSPLPAGYADMPIRPPNKPAGVTRLKSSKPRPKAKHRWKRVALITALVALALGGVLSIGGYFGLYLPAKQLAADGAKHLESAQALVKVLATEPLDRKTLAQTRAEFVAAEDDFQGVNTRLTIAGPFLGLFGFFSGQSKQITSYVHLAHMALDLSTAGHKALDAVLLLIQKEQNAFQVPGSGKLATDFGPQAQPAEPGGAQVANGLSIGDVTGIQQAMNDVVALVEDAWQESQGVVLSALPDSPSLQSAITLFREDYPGLHDSLLSFQGTVQAMPDLFGIGNARTYLVELLDTSERQGAGGFITAYGALGMRQGQLASLTLNDTYLLDTPYQASHSTPLPAADVWFPLTTNWGLRDANLEPDFPTAAKAAEQLYTAESGGKVDGVIAFTPAFFERVLTVIGPVQIPELNDQIDETNLVARLHFYQFKRGAGDSVPASELNSPNGQFLVLLGKYLLEMLRQQTPAASLAILQEVVLGQNTKDVQIYLNNSRAEQSLLKAYKGGAVESPKGDGLFVVDTNISGNKANSNIDQVQQDNVILDVQGEAIHHLVITYQWDGSDPVYGSNTYTDFVRVYVPSGSQIQGYSGFTNFATSTAYGRTLYSGTFTLTPGNQAQITITYSVPHAVQDQSAQLHYALLVQRQPSDPPSQLTLNLILPQNSTLVQHSSNLNPSSDNGSTLALDQLLDKDTTMTADYN